MDEQLAGLQTLTAARRSKLEESIKLHQYIRDVDEVVSWLKEKETVASSDDYGKDYDHLLVNNLPFHCINMLCKHIYRCGICHTYTCRYMYMCLCGTCISQILD